MTDEKLIEEAAKAIHDVAMREYPAMPADIYGWDVQKDRDRDVYLLEARAALAVFEKAHTPTVDVAEEPEWEYGVEVREGDRWEWTEREGIDVARESFPDHAFREVKRRPPGRSVPVEQEGG